jgi:hypothetical protein
MKALATEWTKHCKTPEAKARLEGLVRNSTISLGRLREIVQARIQALQTTERKPETYDSPNWAYKQSHTNGMLAAYNNIDQLLSFLDKE